MGSLSVLMATHSTKGIRLLLQILLLVIFLHFFGLPAIEKYEKREVTSKDTDGSILSSLSGKD